MLSFRYIGHACVQIVYKNHGVLIDPWFGHPFHGGNMVAYPPIPSPSPSVLDSVSLVHVSHIHQDHFCRKSLENLSKNTPILIGEYENKHFAEAISRIGFKKIIQCPRQGFTFGPFRFSVIPLDPFDGSYDSLVIIECGGRKIMLNNDCILGEGVYREIHSRFGDIDYGFLGYCNVSPYPSCYTILGNDTESLITQFQQAAWNHVAKLDGIFKFKRIIPYANGIRLIEPSTRRFNRAFNRIDKASEFLPESVATKVFLTEPGTEWDEDFAPSTLKFQYEASSISNYFDEQGLHHQYAFSVDSPIEPDSYRIFFESYFHRVQRNVGEDLDLACRVLDSSGKSLHRFRYFSNKIHDANDDSLRHAPIVIDYPARWLNEVIRGRMSIASVYYAFQFHVTFKRPMRAKTEIINHWF